MKRFFSVLCITTLILSSCSNNDDTPDNSGGGGEPEPVTATYRITFSPNFDATNFPTDYPANASFSGLIVAVHAPNKQVFSTGAQASAQLQEFAEDGDGAALIAFLQNQETNEEPDFRVFSLNPSAGPTQEQSLNITIDPEKTSITVLSSLSPSPDWFVAVEGFSLLDGPNALIADEDVSMQSYDAGTDSGDTYEAPDNPTNPPGLVTVIETPPIGNPTGPSSVIAQVNILRTDL